MYGRQSQEGELPASQEVCFLTPIRRDREEPSTSQIIGEALETASTLASPDTPRKIDLKRRLFSASHELQKTKILLKQKSHFSAPRSTKHLSAFNRTFVNMQLYHKAKRVWLPEEKKVALSLYYKSPTTYKFLRSKGCILPAPSTIVSWMRTYRQKPGLNNRLLKVVKIKVETMTSKQKECALLFDEMAIKQFLEYNKFTDVIEGVQDLGELGRGPGLAKQALVIMLRGLYSNWKVPLSFYFSENGVKHKEMTKIIKFHLIELSKIGLNPVSIICDQSTTNQKVFKELNVTQDLPFFYINDQKYFAVFDPPHIIKCLRNNLLNGHFLLQNTKVIDLNDIKFVYNLDQQSTTARALLKVTEAHLNPSNFQKMSVKLATQLFSHSVAAAIRVELETGQLKSNSAKYTADFVEIIDNAFDALNSRNLKANKNYRKPITDENCLPMKALRSALEVFSNLVKVNRQGKISRPPSFDSMILTINAVMQLFQQQTQKGYSFLLTSRLNQDPLENQFSIYRQRGGYARNPTVRTFQAAFKSNLVMNLLKPVKTSNCEQEFSEQLLTAEEILNEDPIDAVENDDEINESQVTEDPEQEESTYLQFSLQNQPPSLEESSVVYFAGYLFKKCYTKFKCADCKTFLSAESELLIDNNDILIFFRNFNINNPWVLKKPSQILHDFTHVAMNVFAKYFHVIWTTTELGKNIEKHIVKAVSKEVPTWFNANDVCCDHRNYILKLLIRTILFKECKKLSSSFKPRSFSSNKPLDKLRILQNV